ncbi:MAG: peptidoglycan DD-metalloendopeptidase family protein [Rhodospirillales bacterium]|nr:peptidoglycan DD-metalloendopeptidase family protein [Rhodospirillales bacterium]
MIAGAGVALFVVSLAPAYAETPQLDRVEEELKAARERENRLAAESEALARELASLRERSIAAARAVQDNEAKLTALEARRAALDAENAAKTADFDRRRQSLAALLAALERLARQPPEALAAMPGPPADIVRSAKLLAAAVPRIEREAAVLARDIDALEAVRTRIVAEKHALADAARSLTADRERLAGLIARRASLQRETEADRREAATTATRLAREAADLRELMQRLTAERANREAAARQASEAAARRQQEARLPTPPLSPATAGGPRRFSDARGAILQPARGRVVLSFGQPGEGGQPHRGLSIETRPAAQIVAPFDGQVVFAGPFRGYGQILIIEHTEGYHTLLAGLDRIDAVVGQWVTAGEPVAATGTAAGGNPVLYVELRRNGQPINPLPWLALSTEKVSG